MHISASLLINDNHDYEFGSKGSHRAPITGGQRPRGISKAIGANCVLWAGPNYLIRSAQRFSSDSQDSCQVRTRSDGQALQSIAIGGDTRTKLVAVAHRVLSNTLLTTFFASKYSSANWRANRHWRS
jgi:hypothetical protein